jgi:hypothetical protein
LLIGNAPGCGIYDHIRESLGGGLGFGGDGIDSPTPLFVWNEKSEPRISISEAEVTVLLGKTNVGH